MSSIWSGERETLRFTVLFGQNHLGDCCRIAVPTDHLNPCRIHKLIERVFIQSVEDTVVLQ